MSDENALLAAIAAHPAEDTPRLMYADWLQEHGQPVRAEFIRVQIEIARKDHLPRAVLNQHVDLFQRNQELIDDHRSELLGPLAALTAEAQIEFRRGFVSEVSMSVALFQQVGGAIAATRPLPRVAVRDSVDTLRTFLGFNTLHFDSDGLVSLVSAVESMPSGAEDERWEPVRTLFSPLTWPRLETLDISGCRLGDSNTAELLRADALPALLDLDVSENVLTDDAVEAILASGLLPQLERLILGGNDITDVGAVALAERWPTGDADRLEHLNLRFTNIGQVGQAALLRRFGGRLELF